MTRGLIPGLLVVLTVVTIGRLSASGSPGPATPPGPSSPLTPSPTLERFLTLVDPSPITYRALRHLYASCEQIKASAWMDVWTEIDSRGALTYAIAGEGGSDYIRSRVFRGALDAEKKILASGAPDRAGISHDNYVFEDRGPGPSGLARLAIKPRRKDVLLVDGSIFLRSSDGDLLRLEGRLAKSPSFWIRRVEIIRQYERLAGIRMPVALESAADLVFVGRSIFRMTYDYEFVNGLRIGNPEPTTLARVSTQR